MRRQRTPMIVGGALLALLIGCRATPAPQRTEADRVLAYLQCQECINGERKAVIAMGDTAVVQLRQLLLNGPPAYRVQIVRTRLQRLAPQAPSAVLQDQLSDFDASYRLRAADALSAIGGNAARDAMCRARAQPLRPEVRAKLDTALLSSSCP